MKIGLVLDDTLDSSDGVQQYVINIGKWMNAQGHEVHYLVGRTKRKDLPNIHSLSKNIQVSFNKNKLSMPLKSSKKEITRVLSQYKFDVLHVQVPYSPLFAARVIQLAPSTTAIVGTFHILPFSQKERIATSVLGRVVSKSKARFNEFIAVSKPAQEFAKKYFGINSVVVPNPVTITRKAKKQPVRSDHFEIVFLGRFVKRKGALLLIESFAQLVADNPRKKLHLTMYGTGPLFKQAESRISALGIQKCVTLAGYIDEDKKTAALSRADLAVFPSIGGESFGIVLTEAMAAGAGVVIGGDNPGYRSVLGNDKTLFNPNSIDEFSKCMQQFIDDKHLFLSVHAAQQQLVSQFDINVVGKQLLTIYKQQIAKLQTTNDNR